MNFTLSASQNLPIGSTVAVYPRSNFPADHAPAGAVQGSSVFSGTMGSSSLTITGLLPNTAYVAHATVSAVDRYVAFRTSDATERTLTDMLMPSGMRFESVVRRINSGNAITLATGTIHSTPIWLPAGTTINGIGFLSGSTALATPTHCWAALYKNDLSLVDQSADDTGATWAANTLKSFTLAGSHVTTEDDLWRLALMVAATTPPTLAGVPSLVANAGLAPVLGGRGNTGQTTTAPATLTVTAGTQGLPVAWVF